MAATKMGWRRGLGAALAAAMMSGPVASWADDYEIVLYDNNGNPPVLGLGTFAFTHARDQELTQPPSGRILLTTSQPLPFGTGRTGGDLASGQELSNDTSVLQVAVREVDFEDGKDPANRITGFYVEGLSGTLTGTAQGAPFDGRQVDIEFFVTEGAAGTGSSRWERTWEMRIEGIADTQEGTYGIRNLTAAAAPAPATLLLVLIGLGALALRARGRSRI